MNFYTTHKSCKLDHFTSISEISAATIMKGAVACFTSLQVDLGTLAILGPETGDVHSTVNNLFDAVEFCLEYLVVFRYMFGPFGDQSTSLP